MLLTSKKLKGCSHLTHHIVTNDITLFVGNTDSVMIYYENDKTADIKLDSDINNRGIMYHTLHIDTDNTSTTIFLNNIQIMQLNNIISDYCGRLNLE